MEKTITKAKYIVQKDPSGKETNKTIKATINSVESYVPMDDSNSDYQAILKWVAAGNTIEEAD